MAWTKSICLRDILVRRALRLGAPRVALYGLKSWARSGGARRAAGFVNLGVLMGALASYAPGPSLASGAQAAMVAVPSGFFTIALIATSAIASFLLLAGFERTAAGDDDSADRAHGINNEGGEAKPEHVNGLMERMGHDLRTPLNAIIGFSDMMQQQMHGPLGSDRYHAYAGHIRDSGVTLLAAIEGTLAVTKCLAERGGADIVAAAQDVHSS